jgi:isopentenyl-diphosphate delta-isomerase
LSTGLERISFIHEALPEINLSDIDLSLTLFGKRLSAPILISSMTGGTQFSTEVNERLAFVAEKDNIAMGVGSQRVALENPLKADLFSNIRKIAPNILLFANLGAIQLNNGYSISDCKKAVDMIYADALILHLNPLQEALQDEGNTNFAMLAKKIENLCKNMNVPIVVKEVGWGISKRTAKILYDCGVSAIDVAGAGGTSWSQVEKYRSQNEATSQLASTFRNWGISTVESIRNVADINSGMLIFASGGIQDGLDITKCLALGAVLGGMAGKFLRASGNSSNHVSDLVKLTIEQIKLSMFCTGTQNLSKLSPSLLVEK